jgi:hypothetical protein
MVIDPTGFHIVPNFRARQLAPLYSKWQSDTGQSLGFVSARQ